MAGGKPEVSKGRWVLFELDECGGGYLLTDYT